LNIYIVSYSIPALFVGVDVVVVAVDALTDEDKLDIVIELMDDVDRVEEVVV
jgi:hypothetical protein